MNKHIKAHDYAVSADERSRLNGHQPMVIWLTGLSGSGKSTIADGLEQFLYRHKIHAYTLDGDKVRLGINQDLGFSDADRKENLRRIGEIASLMVDAGLVVLAAFVSPFQSDREKLKQIIGKDKFVEVFVNTSLETCESRDIKGLYKKARAGEIKDFTGISSPYEAPVHPDVEITEKFSVEEAVQMIYDKIKDRLCINTI